MGALDLLPAEHRALDEHLRRDRERLRHVRPQLLDVFADARAHASQRVGRPHHHREADLACLRNNGGAPPGGRSVMHVVTPGGWCAACMLADAKWTTLCGAQRRHAGAEPSRLIRRRRGRLVPAAATASSTVSAVNEYAICTAAPVHARTHAGRARACSTTVAAGRRPRGARSLISASKAHTRGTRGVLKAQQPGPMSPALTIGAGAGAARLLVDLDELVGEGLPVLRPDHRLDRRA